MPSFLLRNNMASTVGTTTDVTSIRIPPQRNAFHAAGRFWVFYCKPDTNDLVYQTSTDGISWGDIVEIAALPSPNGANYDLCFDDTYVHYARNTGESSNRYTGIKYRRGTPQSDGTISWSAVEQTALADGSVADDISLCIDSNGYPWIAYGTSGSLGNPTVTKSSTNDGTWSTASGYPLLLLSSISSLVFLLPQTNGKLAAIIYKTYGSIRERIQVRFYNGVDTWSAIEYVTPDSNDGKLSTSTFAMLCGVAINDEIHIVYKSYGTPYRIQYVHGTSGSWSGLTLLENSGLNSYSTPVITYDGSNLYVFWLRSDNHVYYRKYSGSWETAIDWVDESTDLFTGTRLIQCFYKSYDGNIGLSYQTKASSPYNVRFAFLSFGEATQKAVSGVLSFTGSLSTARIRIVSKGGTLSPAGGLSRSMSKNMQGSLSFVGITHPFTFKSLSGTLSSSGSLTRFTQKIVMGVLSPAGALIKLSSKPLEGAISFTGDLMRNIYKIVAGAISPSGALSPSKIFIQAIGGVLDFAGEVATEIVSITTQAVGGVLSFVGDVSTIKTYVVDLVGYLSSAGEVVKQTSKNLTGAFTPSGILAVGATIYVAIGGVLSFTSSLTRNMSKNVVGLIMPVGIVNKYTRKFASGTLTFTGSVKKMTSKILSGILSLVGNLPHPGRDLTMRLFNRPYRDMFVKSKPHRDMSVESKDE
jgi:hypothetical protein